MSMVDRAESLHDELVRLRRDIHLHPELAFQEFRTAGLVADTLAEVGGFSVRTGVGRTGVVAELGDDGPILAIRADMDALPIREVNQVGYRSTNDGVMHACGHDAHTAILLGVAQLLKESYAEEQWQGRVRLLFQPAEEAFDEKGISGATAMIDDGALDNVDAVIALHVSSDQPSGAFHFQDGHSLAAVDSFEAWIFGDGGHGAYPHTGSDPLAMLVPILANIYAIPSRKINPLHSVVVSLGKICGGSATNVIPDRVNIAGTLRSHDPDTREQLCVELENALKMSELMGGRYELAITKGYPSMFNAAEVNDWMRQTTRDLFGETKVINAEFGMGAEDFAYMTAAARGAMFMLGAAVPEGPVRHHHTNTFDIDERVLTQGAAVLAETARRYLTGSYAPGA
jgi:amidohydrolase